MAGNANSGGDTRFGGERANPNAHQQGVKPNAGGARTVLRYMAGQEFELPEKFEEMTPFQLGQHLLPPKPTATQRGVAVRVAAMILKGADDGIIEQIDGKLPQVNVNAEFAELMGLSDDELLAIAARADRSADTDRPAQGSSGGGDPSATGEAAGRAEDETWKRPTT